MSQKESLRFGNKTAKLIPKDISEGLGKLPPQAIDLEMAILGAVMLERTALAQVSGFLKPEHFYDDRHKEIFIAIIDLAAAATPVDMRTVTSQLRKTGKLELVGNSFYIAELTAGVSSAANVEHHARFVMEMAAKRAIIETASRLQNLAYDDTTDVFKLLEKAVADFKDIDQGTLTQTNEAKIKAMWAETLVETEPPPDSVFVRIYGVDICSSGNHSMLLGKKKSRKTLFVVWLLAQAIKSGTLRPEDIALFDTEQGKSHVWKIRKKLYQLTGHLIPIFYLRGMTPAARREFIRGTVDYWPKKLKFIVIDGIRDLMSNINDPDETTEVIVWLERLTLDHNLHVLEVLHLNKTDNNARGHLGTELLNKAQTTIELELDKKTNSTIVKCESSRDKPFESFAFTHGLDDLPEVVGMPVAGETMPDDDRRARLRDVFEGESLRYKELVDAICKHFGSSTKTVGLGKAQRMVAEFIRMGWIVKSGKDRDPKTVYKLMISDTGPPMKPIEPTQGEIFSQNRNFAMPDPLGEPNEPPDPPPPELDENGLDKDGKFGVF